MNRIKVVKDRNYTVINNTALRDRRLSLKAKGLFAMIMSLPDDWDFTLNGFREIIPEGREALANTIKELIEAGYCQREECRGEGGRIGYDYTFTETPYAVQPHTAFPYAANQQTAEPHTEERLQISKEGISKEGISKEGISKEQPKKETKLSAQKRGFSETLETENGVEEKEKSCAKKEKGTMPAEAVRILDHLNTTAGKSFKPVAANINFIAARLKEGYSEQELMEVIELKTFQWKDDPKMSQYLRPETLFNSTKFAGYVQAVATAKSTPNYATQYKQSSTVRQQPATGGNTDINRMFAAIDYLYSDAVQNNR